MIYLIKLSGFEMDPQESNSNTMLMTSKTIGDISDNFVGDGEIKLSRLPY